MASILVIEDEVPIQMLLRRILGSGGHEVRTASDVASAYAELGERTFEIVFTDLTLPGGPSGSELLSGLAQRASGSSIVVVSGHLPSEVQGLCEELGIAYFLPKPFDLQTVRTLLAKVLAERTNATPGT